MGQLAVPGGGGPPIQAVGAFDEVAVRFLLGYDKPHTRSAYGSDLRCFATWCIQTDIDPLAAQRAHVDAYARSLEADGLASASVARRLSAVSGLLRSEPDRGHEVRRGNPRS